MPNTGPSVGPSKDEAPGVQAERSRVQGTTESADSATAAPHPQGGEAGSDKAFETLRAHLGLHSGCLYRLADGSFLASKWNLSRPLADLHAVAIFARQLTGAM